MVRLSHNMKVRIDRDLHEKLVLKSSERHVSVSDIIREALYEYSYKYGLKAPYKGKVKNANR